MVERIIVNLITISDKLWNKIRNILPKEKPFKTVGRPIVPFAKVLDGILYILRTGYQWKMLFQNNMAHDPPATEDSSNVLIWMSSKRHGLDY